MQRVGVAFSDRPDIRDYVKFGQLAEQLGYDSIWVSEPRMARDAVTGMAILAATTDRIRVGSTVINNWTRGPGLTAVTYATLDHLAPGRIILGIGAYWDPLARNQGIVRTQPLTAMREYVEVVRRLWNLERVTYEGKVVKVTNLELDVAHSNQLQYHNTYQPHELKIPVYIGATGDKMLELSGEIAEGVLLNAPFSISYVRHAIPLIERGAKRAGRDIGQIDLPKLIYISIDRGDPTAWTAIKRKITRYLGQQPHVQKYSGLSSEQLDEIKHAMGGWPPKPGGVDAAMEIVPDEIVRSLVVYGTPDECRKQIRELFEAGVSWPILITEQDDVEEVLNTFAPSTW